MHGKVLKLNKFYFPVGICSWREAIKNIFSLSAFPLDVQYASEEDGQTLESFEWFEPVQSWEKWKSLPIRAYDEYIQTTKGPIRMPSVIVCADYDRIKWNRVLFPTKNNIWERDNYTCCYTGRKLSREELSVDHIIPKSKGGEDTWLNLVTADKEVNRKKGSFLLEETNLKLLSKPFVPRGGLVFPVLRPEWSKFIGNENNK